MRLLPALMIGTALLSTPAMAQEMKALRSITVSGEAHRKVVPDEAHLQVNLNAQDKQMATAKAAHDKKLNALIAIADKAGVDEKKIRTESSSVQPIYTYVNNAQGASQRVFQGYRVQTNIDITVADTSKLGGLMESITSAGFENGANTEWGNLLNMYYTLSDPDKIRDEMLVEAIGNAKAKAQRMADAAGATLASVYQITEGGSNRFQPMPVPMMARAEMMVASDSAGAAPPAGEQKVESSVTVTYELK